MSFTDFTKNDNKSIIWGLLQEGGVFNDISNTNFESVKQLFETSILSMKTEFDIFFDKNDEGDDDYDKKASEMIVNSNKAVIKKMINELGKFKKPQPQPQLSRPAQPSQPSQHLHQLPVSNMLPIPPRYGMNSDSSKPIDSRATASVASISGGKKPKIEEIYRADDLQNHRMSELEVRLKEKQEEMDKMLNNKKPTSIDFSDSKLTDNKLASDEMDRLLANALSSRKQELEQLTMNTDIDNSKKAEEWISGSNDPVVNALNASIAVKRSQEVKRPVEKISTPNVSSIYRKNVSFNEKDNEEISYEKESTNERGDSDNISGEKLSFLSKLKRTQSDSNVELDITDNNNSNYSYNMNRSISTIPLDDFMTDYEEDSADSATYNANVITRDVRDSREYTKIDERINKLQTDIDIIKQTQDKILELLQTRV